VCLSIVTVTVIDRSQSERERRLVAGGRIMLFRIRRVVVLGVVLATGCASTAVRPTQMSAERLPKPDRVVVSDFAVAPQEVSLDRAPGSRLAALFKGGTASDAQLQVGRSVASALSAELVKEIQALGLPAERAAAGAAVPPNSLAVQGQFVSIDEGNRLRRMVIGLGAGGSEVRTLVQVHDQAPDGLRLVAEFETKADSSRKPGMAETMGAGAAMSGIGAAAAASGAVGVATELGDSVESDAQRTAKEIAKQLAQLFHQQGWVK
jgi:hypothetical protein